jgi:hypothetical protein
MTAYRRIYAVVCSHHRTFAPPIVDYDTQKDGVQVIEKCIVPHFEYDLSIA